MLKLLKRILGLKGEIIDKGTNRLAKITGADKDNAFKSWKLNQPLWKQFLIEAIAIIILIYIAYLITGMIFIPIGQYIMGGAKKKKAKKMSTHKRKKMRRRNRHKKRK